MLLGYMLLLASSVGMSVGLLYFGCICAYVLNKPEFKNGLWF